MKRYISLLLSAVVFTTSYVNAEAINTAYDYDGTVKTSSFKAIINSIKASEPATGIVAEPTTEITTESVTEFVTLAAAEPTAEVTTMAAAEPTTEVTTMAAAEPTTEVTTQAAAEPITEIVVPITDETATQNKGIAAKVSDIVFNKSTNLFSVPEGYYLSENMQAHLNRLNKNLKPKITIKIDSINKNVTAEDIASFTDINTGAVDYNKVWSYCGRIMDTYNTAPYSRKFKTHDGVIVNVPVGDYGWRVDMTGLTNNLYQSLINFKDNVFSYKSSKAAFSGNQTVYGNDIGNTYVEVDLSNQTVHWFKNGACVLSDYCVTGKKSTPTPAGTWSLKCNTGRSNLKGPDWDVWVNYWAHFSQGCGFHDASWQPSFGLARWKAGYGSHGCVNLSPATAKKAKAIMQIGEPVIVYYR